MQPGNPPILVHLDGDSATIGRSSECDVVIRDRHVSKRHLRLMYGLVAVDLGSANGTFVDEERIEGPTLVRSGRLRLGLGEVEIEWEDGIEATALQAGDIFTNDSTLKPLRPHLVEVPDAEPDAEVRKLRAEIATLLRRIEALEGQ